MTIKQFMYLALCLVTCFGDLATFGFLLSWRDRAATPSLRRARLLRGVVPGAVVLGALLLTALVQAMLRWSEQ